MSTRKPAPGRKAVALSDLAGIKKQLAEAAAAQAAEAARAAAQAQRLAAQKNLFENAVGKVQRLPDPGLADISPRAPAAASAAAPARRSRRIARIHER